MGRPPLRPQPESVRDGGIRVKTRRKGGGNQAGELDVPEQYRQPGIDYQWIRESVYGKEEPSYVSSMFENGWEPVQLADMPSFGAQGSQGVVRKDGAVLCWRPLELTQEAREEDYARAVGQVRGNVQQMLTTDPAKGLPVAGAKFNSSFERPSGEFNVHKAATSRVMDVED